MCPWLDSSRAREDTDEFIKEIRRMSPYEMCQWMIARLDKGCDMETVAKELQNKLGSSDQQ